jgi:hypothetical protein
MGGVGVFVWLAIGAAAGWMTSRLMVSGGDDALRGTAAGMIGAVLGGLGMRLVEWAPGLVSNDVNTFAAALAGSLWLTWATCVATSGREHMARPRTPAQRMPRAEATHHRESARPVPTYAAARAQLVEQLLGDAVAHDAERYDDIGRRFESVERLLPHGRAPELGKLRVAVTFWDGWIHARNRGWQPDGSIPKGDWPLLARTVAADLAGDRDVTDTRVVASFDVRRHPSLSNRVQALAAWLRVE